MAVDNGLTRQRGCPRVGHVGGGGLGEAGIEDMAENLVDRHERGGHARRGLKKRRRDRPCRRASRSPSSLSLASTARCFALCGAGRYSSLDTICVGTGDGNDEISAGSNSLSCSSVRNFMISSLRATASWRRSVTPQQDAQDRDRCRGVDPDRPSENRNFAGQCSDIGLNHRKPVFDMVEPIFYMCKSAFYAAEAIFDVRKPISYAANSSAAAMASGSGTPAALNA